MPRAVSLLCAIAAVRLASAAPTGLNVIPTTDIVPSNSLIAAIQNGNSSFSGTPFYKQPQFNVQSQCSLESWLEAGLDYTQTPDLNFETAVLNVKALFLTEDYNVPNAAFGVWNVTNGQKLGYYLTFSKTLNYEEEQRLRFSAHHRRNRKLLGRRIHVGAALDGHGTIQPFAGTDIQLSETAVFQADWVYGAGNAISAGVAYVLADGRTTITPALLFSNEDGHPTGLLLNIGHQFNF
jgi:hypothetical protein